jgi:hypothetical protein
MKIRFYNEECDILFGTYSSGRISISLMCSDGELMARATIDCPEIQLKKNEVIIKDYSENEGILSALVEYGVVVDTGKRVPVGYAEGVICKLTPEASIGVLVHTEYCKKFKEKRNINNN